MKPSTVIRVAGALLIAVGLMQLFSLLIALNYQLRQRTILSDPFNYSLFATRALPILGSSAWVLATAFGLFRRRAWARRAVIALCLVGVFGFLGGVAGALFGSLPHYPQLPRWLSLALYGVFLGAGGISAVLVAEFTSIRMDEAFSSSFAPRLRFFDAISGTNPAPASAWSGIPLSVSVIAFWLIIVWPLGFCEAYFRTGGIISSLVPAVPLGGVLYGRLRILYLLAMTSMGIVTGIGLLRLREWARITALAACGFSVLGVVLSALRPHSFKALAEYLGSLNLSISPAFFLFSAIWAIIPVAWSIYFLIKRKEFFRRTSAPPPPPDPLPTAFSG